MTVIYDARERIADAQIDQFLAGVGMGFNGYIERQGRRAEVARLSAMSDAELARIGVQRNGIVPFVFRDLLSL